MPQKSHIEHGTNRTHHTVNGRHGDLPVWFHQGRNRQMERCLGDPEVPPENWKPSWIQLKSRLYIRMQISNLFYLLWTSSSYGIFLFWTGKSFITSSPLLDYSVHYKREIEATKQSAHMRTICLVSTAPIILTHPIYMKMHNCPHSRTNTWNQ